MSEDQVALINETMKVLEYTTTTTAADYKEVTKIKAGIPTDAYKFIILLKTLANLLFALFRSARPLFCISKSKT